MDPKPPSGPTSPVTSPKNKTTAQSSIKDEAINSHHSSDIVSSPVSDSTHESTCHRSPPMQVMERPDDLDFSNRFSTSSSEWSSASDESLFSIHLTNSCPHDQAHLPEHSSQSNVGSLKAESLSKLDAHTSSLDEPQKVVRWKTQVERLADEGVNSQDQRVDSSPLKDHKSSEPKKKFCWSTCDCGSCNLAKWSCWNECWKFMSCSNCKPKDKGPSHSKEANAPTSASPKKPSAKHQKLDMKKWCCFGSCLACFRSCSCHCCWGDIST